MPVALQAHASVLKELGISHTELMPNSIHERPPDGATAAFQFDALKIRDTYHDNTFHAIPCPMSGQATVRIACAGAMDERNATRVFAS